VQILEKKCAQIIWAILLRKIAPKRRNLAQSGTNAMILKIFSPKNLAKIFAFFAQTTVSFCKNCDHNIGF
jgi:hypothetical protein